MLGAPWFCKNFLFNQVSKTRLNSIFENFFSKLKLFALFWFVHSLQLFLNRNKKRNIFFQTRMSETSVQKSKKDNCCRVFWKIQLQHFWNVFFNSSQSLLELKKLLDVNLFAHWKIKNALFKRWSFQNRTVNGTFIKIVFEYYDIKIKQKSQSKYLFIAPQLFNCNYELFCFLQMLVKNEKHEINVS